jgi:hypothetical protein
MSILTRASSVLLLVCGTAAAALAQGAATATSVPPIECWWRTGASAVRVGEPFTVVLTCAVLETVSTTVVPDQSRLDPTVLQLQPFEVTGGRQAPDLRTTSRRFFQYEYDVRYIGEEFGRDVPLPALSLAYRVQSRTEAGAAAIETRDKTYILPSQQVRIVTLVPTLASDIRERAPDSFVGIDARRFRANLLGLLATILFALAGVVAVWAGVRAMQRRRGVATAGDARVSDAAILATLARDVAGVARARQQGWTTELALELLQALRVAGAYETLGRAAQAPVVAEGGPDRFPGQFLVRSWLRPGRAAMVTGTATAGHLAREIARREARGGVSGPITDLHQAIAALESALYGRETPARLDLDDALEAGQRAVASLRRSHGWLALRVAALKDAATGLRTRVWAR